MVFNVKMEDFRRKTRLVAGGLMTKAPAPVMYSSIVSRETFGIALMITTLNDLETDSGHILNAYLQALVTEKVLVAMDLELS